MCFQKLGASLVKEGDVPACTDPPANRNGLLEPRARTATHNKTRRRPVVATRGKLKYYSHHSLLHFESNMVVPLSQSVSDAAAPASHSDPSSSTKTSSINAISLCAFGRSDRAAADTASDERPDRLPLYC
ncbi:hypothetical protein EVAR_9180_1 [Eumeta japonica]|uniref:Uncharacterized protein n=1 Tax=Eumeta variegata TaxID=151549 RepID=A0A4C1WPL5_EUMVA|nr:hypothetical protein EVAR_9180_1 [Eumeta japonica]